MSEHCVFDAATGEARCLRCGERHRFALPMEVTRFCKEAKAFTELHRECKPAASSDVSEASKTTEDVK